MRHQKKTFKIGKTASHRRCMVANMLKSLVDEGRIETTLRKGKELKRHADRLITYAKQGTLQSRRLLKGKLMVRYNTLTSKQLRAVKGGDRSCYNSDRRVLNKLDELALRFSDRNGGYTRLIKTSCRKGDASQMCLVSYLGVVESRGGNGGNSAQSAADRVETGGA